MGKTLRALGLAGLILLGPNLAKAEFGFAKFLKNASSKLEFGVSAGIQFGAKNPAQAYIDGVNKDFRDGKYTFTTPIPQWKNISISNPLQMPLEFSILYKPTEKIKVGLTGAISSAKAESKYNESYDLGIYNTPYNFDRKENVNMNSSSIGIKAEADLTKWLTASLSGKLDNYSISGNVDYTLFRPDTNYTQWRDIDYSGTGTGTSLEAGLDFNITKNISVGVAGGIRGGKVECKGKHLVATTSGGADNWVESSIPYNPSFDMNSTYLKLKTDIKF